jgi:hypothetical protein
MLKFQIGRALIRGAETWDSRELWWPPVCHPVSWRFCFPHIKSHLSFLTDCHSPQSMPLHSHKSYLESCPVWKVECFLESVTLSLLVGALPSGNPLWTELTIVAQILIWWLCTEHAEGHPTISSAFLSEVNCTAESLSPWQTWVLTMARSSQGSFPVNPRPAGHSGTATQDDTKFLMGLCIDYCP